MIRPIPHLLFITSLVADGRPSTGYEVANEAIIDGLRRIGARITVVGYSRPGAQIGENTVLLGQIDPTTHSAKTVEKMRWLLRSVRQNVPFSVAKLQIIDDTQLEQALHRAGPADALILNAAQMSAAFETVLTRGPFFYVAHNVEHRSATENAEAAGNPLLRLLYHREARLLKAIEDRLCRKAQFVFTLSEEDRQMFGLADEARSAALPLVTRRDPVTPDIEPECDATLIGTWTWQPNLIGLLWFLDQVLPLLPDDFSVRIAGATPTGLADRYPRAEFVGRVPDATQFVCSGRVVPLISRAGTGVQLKTIETFELGLPSVATRHSLRGIADVPSNCVIASDPRSFAAALVQAARGKVSRLDGRSFHRQQMQQLDRTLSNALRCAGITLPELQL